ncbi:MAG TPA: ABC transporter permease [Candidatus Acidoferrales bacterium]|jgi:ABC-2 type transport system permease protein|nr:ABC transporter permease [Candidatus Acidoferrales bacterium]
MKFLRNLFAFLKRDFQIESSYHTAFVFQIFETLFAVASFYYLSHFVQSPELTRALPNGNSYFSFALVGVAFLDYMYVALSTFDQTIEEARRNGTLEAMLVTESSVPVILAGSSLFTFVSSSLRTGIYLGWGLLLFGFPTSGANWLGAFMVLTASVLAFAGLGILSASYLLLFMRGNPAKWLLLGLSGVVGGTMYPVSILPHWLQAVARLLPITYTLEGLRAALLGGASFGELWHPIRALLMFAVVLLPASCVAFSWALRRTKTTGTLTHF